MTTEYHLTIHGQPLCRYIGCMAGLEIVERAGVLACSYTDHVAALEAGRAIAAHTPPDSVKVVQGQCPEVPQVVRTSEPAAPAPPAPLAPVEPLRVWVVEGEHPTTPGVSMSVHSTEAGAVAVAVNLTRLIRDEFPTLRAEPITPQNWESVLRDCEDAAFGGGDSGYFYVIITPATVQP